MQPFPELPNQLQSAQVLARFGLRLIVMAGFAAFGRIGFGSSIAALLWMSAILCAVVGVMRREPLLASGLNHWDEMTA